VDDSDEGTPVKKNLRSHDDNHTKKGSKNTTKTSVLDNDEDQYQYPDEASDKDLHIKESKKASPRKSTGIVKAQSHREESLQSEEEDSDGDQDQHKQKYPLRRSNRAYKNQKFDSEHDNGDDQNDEEDDDDDHMQRSANSRRAQIRRSDRNLVRSRIDSESEGESQQASKSKFEIIICNA
jgi:hypothetical protein